MIEVIADFLRSEGFDVELWCAAASFAAGRRVLVLLDGDGDAVHVMVVDGVMSVRSVRSLGAVVGFTADLGDPDAFELLARYLDGIGCRRGVSDGN